MFVTTFLFTLLRLWGRAETFGGKRAELIRRVLKKIVLTQLKRVALKRTLQRMARISNIIQFVMSHVSEYITQIL